MILHKIQLNLKLNKDIKNIEKKYYAVLGAVYDLVDNQDIFEKYILSISPLIKQDNQNYKLFVSLFGEEKTKLFIHYCFEKKHLNIDKLDFSINGIDFAKTLDLEKFSPNSDFKKVLFHFQSPTLFGKDRNSTYIDIQPFNIFKSINKKLLKIGIDINLDLLELEKNTKLIGIKNLNTEKVKVKNNFKIGFVGKLFFEIKGTEIFKKQINYLTNVAEFTGIGLNPKLGLGNVYGKCF